MCLLAGMMLSSVNLCTGSERVRAETAEAAAKTARRRSEALEADQAQQAEHVLSLGKQV